jgi:hypothetical protein
VVARGLAQVSTDNELAPLCTTVEPVDRLAMCQRPWDHPMPHQAKYEKDGGTVTAEWHDPSALRGYLKRIKRGSV